jgi:dipeptidyl aminopeptidase/acylaminoacyl peptidase
MGSPRVLRRALGVVSLLLLGPLAPAAHAHEKLVFNGDIAFVNKGETIEAVFRDGTQRRILAKGNDPTYSPDGKKIVYSAGASIWVMNADGTRPRRVIDTGEWLRDLDWSPDGTGFLWRESFDGNKQRVRALRLFETEPSTLFGGAAETVDSAVWTPDNKVLAGLYSYQPQFDFAVADRTGAVRENVAWSVERAHALDVAPDGRIVFAEDRRVYVEDGGFFHSFEVVGDGSVGDLAVSPDGMWVVHSRIDAGTQTGLWVSRLDGSRMRQITRGAHTAPTWRGVTSVLPNQPPRVVATITYAPQQTIVADARASFDVDGVVTQWEWSFGDGQPTAQVAYTTRHYDAPGTYYVELTITDNLGAKTTRGTWVVVPGN